MTIADNLARVRERIDRAAERAGRRPDEVLLVGVTKYVGIEEVLELRRCGCHHIGENRPQELWRKAAVVPSTPGPFAPPILWHLIGHLQRNKIRRTLPVVHMIHSVDSERLLTAINDELAAGAARRGSALKVLLEVNTSGEEAKHGIWPNDVEPIIAKAPQWPHVAICGLMTMAALEGGSDTAARNFAALRVLEDRLRENAPPGVTLDELSMGMSGDFEVAIAEGATIVRIGSALWAD